MRNLLLALLLALVATGCTNATIGPTDTVGISLDFTADEQEQILAAADEWSRATNGAINLDMRIGLEAGQHGIVSAPGLRASNDGEEIYGVSLQPLDRDQVTIQLNLEMIYATGNPGALRHIVLHELAHALGLIEHTKTGLLREFFKAGDQPCILESDAKLMCDSIGCPGGYRGTCEG